ncbi:DUF354 domain-containing protein [Wenzhouxiangella limi]|uniref:DUF354 domain-containing protein n=1 Tax=Wenzhouxiangella limi TaxID=2707351 RepID=A0A845V5I0_9GAMM|nr:DUF354 domain-containing protein [Wenzhouxiangella limi]NDY95225.1 DUF354 domain-containing protein [Wenzhouxiangella limi]
MRILFDITHPAHVHFFRNPIRMLVDAGHVVKVTSRDKDCTLQLLDRFGIPNECLSDQNSGGILGMAGELLLRDSRLFRVARDFRPDVLAAIGGIWVAQVGWLLRKPSVVFYDTETARLQNALTYPFATRIVVPECYTGKLPEHKAVRYRGYHELSYLHPNYFTPRREIALENGLAPDGDTFLIRLVSWKASHDVGLKGWSAELLGAVVDTLRSRGRVVISAEGDLPAHLRSLRYCGDTAQIHHLMAFCRASVGESATMTSECVVMGVPAVYAATESRGYVNEQAERYGMVKIAPAVQCDEIICAIEAILDVREEEIEKRHRRLLDETVDVTGAVVSQIIQGARK